MVLEVFCSVFFGLTMTKLFRTTLEKVDIVGTLDVIVLVGSVVETGGLSLLTSARSSRLISFRLMKSFAINSNLLKSF